MVRDVNLVLDSGQTVTATSQTTAIDVEGGMYCDFRLFMGTCTGTTPTLDADLEVSIDGGSNYYKVGSIPKLDESDDDIVIARVAFIPKPASGQTVTKVRLNYTVGGTSPSYGIDKAFLEPITGAVPKALDVNLAEGIAKLL